MRSLQPLRAGRLESRRPRGGLELADDLAGPAGSDDDLDHRPAPAPDPLRGRRFRLRRTRRPDPRIAQRIRAGLGDAGSVVNVGAGLGAYEPDDIEVTAVEPAAAMVAARPAAAAPCVCAAAESCRLPTPASTPRWPCSPCSTGATRGRLGRAAPRCPPACRAVHLDNRDRRRPGSLTTICRPSRERDRLIFPTVQAIVAGLALQPVRRDHADCHDCLDGFFSACWRRQAYLDRSSGRRRSVELDHIILPRQSQPPRRRRRGGAWRHHY